MFGLALRPERIEAATGHRIKPGEVVPLRRRAASRSE